MQDEGIDMVVFDDRWETVELKAVDTRQPAIGALLSCLDILGRLPAKLPTLQLFGHQKGCSKTISATIYGYFPYFYIKIEEFRDSFLDQRGLPVHEKLVSFASVLEGTFGLAHQSKPGFRLVYDLQVVRKLDFYGYNRTPQVFLKISLYSPAKQRKAADLLQGGAVGGAAFKCYEVHFDYSVKFFRDAGSGGFHELRLPANALDLRVPGSTVGSSREWKEILSTWMVPR